MASERTTLSFKGLNGVDPVANWQVVDKSAGDGTDRVWRGGGINIKGDNTENAPATLTVDRVELHRLILKGNRTRTASHAWPASTVDGDGWDITDKAFRVVDSWVGDIVCTDTDMIGWRGEIFCLLGAHRPARWLTLDRCRFLTTNGNALNIGMPVPYVVRDFEFGDAYLAEESTGMVSGRYINCIWRDSETVWMGGAQVVAVAGYLYKYPVRNNATQPPLISIEGGEFRNISVNVDIGSWTRGKFRMVDAPLTLSTTNRGALQDVVLDVEMWLDQNATGPIPVGLFGPAALNTQFEGAPVGTYYTPPANVHVKVAARRTKLAVDNNRHWGRIQWGGYINKSCRIIVDGLEHPHGGSPATTSYPPVSHPYVELRDAQFTSASVPHGVYHIGAVNADTQITPPGPMANISGTAGATWNITLATTPTGGSAYGYVDKQKFRLQSNGSALYRFVPSASIRLMAAERILYGAGDWIEFAYSQWSSWWEEVGYYTGTQTEFNGSATYDAPSIAAAGSTSTTVTATGAAVGDLVEAVSFGVSTAGLVVTAQVTAANTVTVWLYNPTAAAINLASTTLRVRVRKP